MMAPRRVLKMHDRLVNGRCACGYRVNKAMDISDFIEHAFSEAALHDPSDPKFSGCERTDVHHHEPRGE